MIVSPSFKTTSLFKRMMAEYLDRGVTAKEKGIPIAWVTATFPVEIINAAGLFPYYPENFGARIAARKVAATISAAAEQQGYFPDLCAYARCGIGNDFSVNRPVGEVLKPDVIFCSNAQCGSLQKWFEAAGRHYQVPFFLIDTPLIENTPTTLIKRYIVDQLHELLDFLELYTGNTFDFSRLAEVISLSNEACRLWSEILAMAALKPAPFSYFDACYHLAPIVAWRGTKWAVDYYKELKKELEERLDNKVYVIPDERYKLYFDHIPVWPRLRWFSNLLLERKALAVASQYTHAWAWRFDLNRPLESLVKNYTEVFINRGYEHRLEQTVSLMDEFKVDGFILFSNRSCKPKALGLYDKYDIISKRTGLPGVIFEADMSDERYFNEEYIKKLFGEFFNRLEREST